MNNNYLMNSVDLPNGESIFYREIGAGERVMLLVHGNTNSSKNWDILMESLPHEDYRMIALDLRGFGDSSYNRPINSIKDFSEDVKLFVDTIGLDKFVLVGWSAGGAVSLQFSAVYPERVDKLILLAGASVKGYPMFKRGFLGKVKVGEYVTTKEEISKQFKILIGAIKNKKKWLLRKILNMSLYTINKPSEERMEAYVDVMTKQRNAVEIAYALINFNISHEYNGVVQGTGEVDKIVAPTLIIQGDKDKLVPMEMAKTNLAALGDKAKLVIIENSGHVPLVDNLARLKEEIINFTK